VRTGKESDSGTGSQPSNIFKSNIPTRLKKTAFNQGVLPVLTNGAETLTLNKSSIKKLHITRKMERLMLGLTLRNRVKIILLSRFLKKKGDGGDTLQG